jgi:hypothetical protein
MAPTKPLVAQQIEACFNIMGIPQVSIQCCGSGFIESGLIGSGSGFSISSEYRYETRVLMT